MNQIIHKNNTSLFNNLIAEFEKAENRLKLIERQNIQEGIDIPSINELRYAACHIIRALKENDSESPEDTQEEEIKRAIRHCQRASYDAIEAGILSQLYIVKEFQEEYKNIVISTVIKDWNEILITANNINKTIQDVKINDEKEDNYEIIHENHIQLEKHTRNFGIYREELNKIKIEQSSKDALIKEQQIAIERQEENHQKQNKALLISRIISAALLAVAAIQLIINLTLLQ